MDTNSGLTGKINLETLFTVAPDAISDRWSTASGNRIAFSTELGTHGRLDSFKGVEATCCFVRHFCATDGRPSFKLEGGYQLRSFDGGGWLAESADPDAPLYWIPASPVCRKIDTFGRIAHENAAVIAAIDVSATAIGIELEVPAGRAVDAVFWRFPAHERALIDGLADRSAVESTPIFLWGSHTPYQAPADLYRHLIFGHVYENRSSWPLRLKIFSENDAHALYVALKGLQRVSHKPMYRVLAQQLVISVLTRQAEDGGWYHGEWTHDMESHFRLHASALHLLLDALDESPDPACQAALEKGVHFLAERVSAISAGSWFLHDSLEISPESMATGPFKWIPSNVLGKQPSNMLVLNTHLDTCIALARAGQWLNDDRITALVTSARAATRQVLELAPMEWLYGGVFKLVRLTLLPEAEAKQLPLGVRALKRIAWKYLIPRLPALKTRFPRLVMPGGYVERELSLNTWAHPYQSINVMDLVRYRRCFADASLDQLIASALQFTEESGIRRKWAEMPKQKYALGFWAEALYQVLAQERIPEHCAWLAQALMELDAAGLGIPPSLLGANAEVMVVVEQPSAALLANPNIRVAYLPCEGGDELLLVNTGTTVEPVNWQIAPAVTLQWQGPEGLPASPASPSIIEPRSWLLGRMPEAGI